MLSCPLTGSTPTTPCRWSTWYQQGEICEERFTEDEVYDLVGPVSRFGEVADEQERIANNLNDYFIRKAFIVSARYTK